MKWITAIGAAMICCSCASTPPDTGTNKLVKGESVDTNATAELPPEMIHPEWLNYTPQFIYSTPRDPYTGKITITTNKATVIMRAF